MLGEGKWWLCNHEYVMVKVVKKDQFGPKSMMCVLIKSNLPMLVDILAKGKLKDYQCYLKFTCHHYQSIAKKTTLEHTHT